MPSTCSSIVLTLCSLPPLCLDWFLDADNFSPYCEVSRTVQYLKGIAWARLVWVRESSSERFGNSQSWYFKMVEVLTGNRQD